MVRFLAWPQNPWRDIGSGGVATYFRRISREDLDAIRSFVDLLRGCVAIRDLLHVSFALDFRAEQVGGKLERTETGNLVYRAKGYGGSPDMEAADKLAQRMTAFVRENPCCSAVGSVVGMPPSDPKRPFVLPHYLAASMARDLSFEDRTGHVRKVRATAPAKEASKEMKLDVLASSIAVEARLDGKVALLVDDLYQSGTSINYVAALLRQAGAVRVLGLTAVKTLRNDDNLDLLLARQEGWSLDEDG
jgi:hypothetical protein